MTPLLSIRNLRTQFLTEQGVVRAVDGVSLDVARGETIGIVGESGSGKSVTSLSILGLVPSPPGRVDADALEFDGISLPALSDRERRALRGRRIAMIFQDPMTSLNPFLRISAQLMEVTQLHLRHGRAEARAHALQMLERVGIPDAASRMDAYPHELSGGMRQRVMIAMALSCGPDLLIADEPTTALDVTIQAQILDLIGTLRRETGTSVLLITHDLGVVAGMADRVVVMYAGQIVESAPTRALFARPAHPYTQGLLRSVPRPSDDAHAPLTPIPGLPPDLSRPLPGCPFAPRCSRAIDVCHTTAPPLEVVAPAHQARCHIARDVYAEAAR